MALRCSTLPPMHCLGLVFGRTSTFKVGYTCKIWSMHAAMTSKRTMLHSTYRGGTALQQNPALLPLSTSALLLTRLWAHHDLVRSKHLQAKCTVCTEMRLKHIVRALHHQYQDCTVQERNPALPQPSATVRLSNHLWSRHRLQRSNYLHSHE